MEKAEKEMERCLLLILIVSNNGNVKEIDMRDIWNYEPSSNPSAIL